MGDHRTAGVLWMGAAVVAAVGGLTAVLTTLPTSPPPADLPEIREGAILSVDPARVRGIDHRQVHEVLVPDWVRATGGLKTLYWERLRRAVASDPNLTALLDRMDVLIAAGPAGHVEELRAIVQAWNDVVASADVDYRLEGQLVEPDGWELKTYRNVPVDAEVVVDGATFGVTVRHRLDTAASPDAWLGQLEGARVLVLLDRVTSLAMDRIWPLLDPRLDAELDPLSARFAPAVRAEVAAVIAPDALSALVETAEDRLWLLRATDAVHRRGACGSAFRIEGLPWSGLPADEIAALHERARSAEGDCPEITEREALVFAVRSRHVGQREGVREALEQLVAFVAEAVVTHEARHAADLAAQADGRPLACAACPPTLSPVALWEGSAYLATFAEPRFAALALFQACDVDPGLRPDSAAVIGFLAAELTDRGCAGAPADDLAARASALGGRLFGRVGGTELRGFPAGLPVSSEYGSR